MQIPTRKKPSEELHTQDSNSMAFQEGRSIDSEPTSDFPWIQKKEEDCVRQRNLSH